MNKKAAGKKKMDAALQRRLDRGVIKAQAKAARAAAASKWYERWS